MAYQQFVVLSVPSVVMLIMLLSIKKLNTTFLALDNHICHKKTFRSLKCEEAGVAFPIFCCCAKELLYGQTDDKGMLLLLWPDVQQLRLRLYSPRQAVISLLRLPAQPALLKTF